MAKQKRNRPAMADQPPIQQRGPQVSTEGLLTLIGDLTVQVRILEAAVLQRDAIIVNLKQKYEPITGSAEEPPAPGD